MSAAQPYVAIDWDPEMKKRFYNENEAEVSVNVCVFIYNTQSDCTEERLNKGKFKCCVSALQYKSLRTEFSVQNN